MDNDVFNMTMPAGTSVNNTSGMKTSRSEYLVITVNGLHHM